MTLTDILSHTWCHLSFLLGLAGNTYVVYSTVFHRAIKLDKLSIWIIQMLAVSDLANTVLVLVPVIISLYADSTWILGDTFCNLSFVYKYLGYIANVILINALAFNKMMRCLFPLRNMNCSRSQRWSVAMVTVIGTLMTPIYHSYKTSLKDVFSVQFSRSQCMCWMVQIAEPPGWHYILDYGFSGLLNALPCLTLIGINTFLVTYAVKKSTRPVNKMNIAIVVLITASFLVSSLPYFIYYMVSGDVWEDDDVILRFVTFIMFTMFWSNPVIYLATNKYFRKFTVGSVRRDARTSIGQNMSFRNSTRRDPRASLTFQNSTAF